MGGSGAPGHCLPPTSLPCAQQICISDSDANFTFAGVCWLLGIEWWWKVGVHTLGGQANQSGGTSGEKGQVRKEATYT